MENGVYIISVAARLLEVHPQTLRKYEKFGLDLGFSIVKSGSLVRSSYRAEEGVGKLLKI